MTTRGFLAQSVTPAQAALVTGRSVDCENGENRMEDKQSEHSLPADSNTHWNSAHLFVCLSEGGWKPGL